MERPFCEVIGCISLAAWVRVEDGTGNLEDYLCDRCYLLLSARIPNYSYCYVSAQEFPALFGPCDMTDAEPCGCNKNGARTLPSESALPLLIATVLPTQEALAG